jgi:hypothetical protein
MPTKQRNQHIFLPIILVLLIATVLCTGYADAAYYDDPPFDSSAYIEVKSDGTISELNIVTTISNINNFVGINDTYSFISSWKSNEDGDFATDAVHTGTDLIFSMKNKNPITISEEKNLHFTSDDGKITFRIDKASIAANSALLCLVLFMYESCTHTYTYTIKMPGKIVNSNADQVNGDTAVWFFRNGVGVTDIWATSSTSAQGSPLGGLVIFCGICAAVGLFFWRRS